MEHEAGAIELGRTGLRVSALGVGTNTWEADPAEVDLIASPRKALTGISHEQTAESSLSAAGSGGIVLYNRRSHL